MMDSSDKKFFLFKNSGAITVQTKTDTRQITLPTQLAFYKRTWKKHFGKEKRLSSSTSFYTYIEFSKEINAHNMIILNRLKQ